MYEIRNCRIYGNKGDEKEKEKIKNNHTGIMETAQLQCAPRYSTIYTDR